MNLNRNEIQRQTNTHSPSRSFTLCGPLCRQSRMRRRRYNAPACASYFQISNPPRPSLTIFAYSSAHVFLVALFIDTRAKRKNVLRSIYPMPDSDGSRGRGVANEHLKHLLSTPSLSPPALSMSLCLLQSAKKQANNFGCMQSINIDK